MRCQLRRSIVATCSLLVTAGTACSEDTRLDISHFAATHCTECHNQDTDTAGINFDQLLEDDIYKHVETWEKVVRQLTMRQMPPLGSPRPDAHDYDEIVTSLAESLDAIAAEQPHPGRTETFRRLTRTEYRNAIRDLLGLNIDLSELLPTDESSHGFDNVTVAGLSPTLVNRYLAAATKISRLAVGRPMAAPAARTVRLQPDITQDTRVEGLPPGTRGGTQFSHQFPRPGEYEVAVRLMRDRNEEVESLRDEHELEIRLDRERLAFFTIAPPRDDESHASVDAGLKTRFRTTAGTHDIAVTFIQQSSSLLETRRQPLNVHFNFYRHPRLGPAVYEVSIVGPFNDHNESASTRSQHIFICEPSSSEDDSDCARRILERIALRAYRRPVDGSDLETLLEFFERGREEHSRDEHGFDAGIERAISAILMSPHFLLRMEPDPPNVPPKTAYSLSDIELASRLSFFLWSSIPDDELIDVATRGKLRQPDVLKQQVQRMLADERSHSLVDNFAAQWLHLMNLDSANPDMRLFPDFDHNLRESMRRETDLLFETVLREDHSVLQLIRTRQTFLNERLATHYGIPHVNGSRFRRVSLEPDSRRGGLLRHGSILTVTSYATRTSPVLRGTWVLDNLLGTPPPPPPPDVPALEEITVDASLSVRERLSVHRANAACAACHDAIDPVGFALENFDAVGRWRTTENGRMLDVSGGLPDGNEFEGISGLEAGLLRRPEIFVAALTEKLLTYALGRGIEYHDAPAIRGIVRQAREDDYRFSAIIQGIVNSTLFQMRTTE